jgi:hypothetical protein
LRINSLNKFGEHFEFQLLNIIIGTRSDGGGRNYKFGENIIPILDEKYFTSDYTKRIVKFILVYHEKYASIPYYTQIEARLQSGKMSIDDREICLQIVDTIKNTAIGDEREWIKNQSKRFFKIKNAQNELARAKAILDEYDGEDTDEAYGEFQTVLHDVLKINDIDEAHYHTVQFNENDIDDDNEEYLKTGLGEGLDNIFMNGRGYVKGGLHGIIAPSGAGKTTMSTVILDSNFSDGKTVVQIFFEGRTKDMKKLQRSRWSGLNRNEINKKNAKLIVRESNESIKLANTKGGNWFIKKMPPKSTAIGVKLYLDKLISQGYVIDLVSIDYLECMSSVKSYEKDWMGELEIVQQFEYMCSDECLNFACILYFQGNRGGQNAKLLLAEHLGGNFKKVQPCHTLMTLAVPFQNASVLNVNIAILKNRDGQDKIAFVGCKFDRGCVKFDIKPENQIDDIDEFMNS